jgi:hypothetical protein
MMRGVRIELRHDGPRPSCNLRYAEWAVMRERELATVYVEENRLEDLETSDRYLEIPHKNDLDLGRQLALRFTEERLADQYNRVTEIFHRRGAYRWFKELLAAEGCLEQWYAFETEATEQSLKEWCQENNIHLAERDEEQSA